MKSCDRCGERVPSVVVGPYRGMAEPVNTQVLRLCVKCGNEYAAEIVAEFDVKAFKDSYAAKKYHLEVVE